MLSGINKFRKLRKVVENTFGLILILFKGLKVNTQNPIEMKRFFGCN